MTAPSPIGVTCATCAFFSPGVMHGNRGDLGGQCRRHAPVIDRVDARIRTIWPLVWEDNWCGEHAVVEAAE